MAVYEILPTTNLKWDDIRDTLNANGGNVNNSAVTAFQSSANINKWSKYKAVRLNENFPSYDTYYTVQDGLCGFGGFEMFDQTSLLQRIETKVHGSIYCLEEDLTSLIDLVILEGIIQRPNLF